MRTLNIDEPLARITGSTVRHYVRDGLGSVIALTDETGGVKTTFTYDAYGNVTTTGEASDNPFQYTGRENDGTWLLHYRLRYYSPEIGRFISEDPIGLLGGSNFYAYVQNNPVNWTDPFGLEVYICGRPANLPFPANLANHEWLMTDTKEAGMGAVAGVIPAQNGNSNLPGVPVQVVDHTGQFDAENSSCEYVPTTDEACVNNELVLGRNLGTWGATNNCQTFVNDVINKCTK